MAVDVLVTGGAGVLGQRIVHNLRLSNYEVVSCGRILGDNVDAVWDISRQDTPEPDCKPAVVVHAAAQIGPYQQSLSAAAPLLDVNVIGTFRVVQWCLSRGVGRLILISSAIVYGEWADFPKVETDPVKPWIAGPYAVSKWCSEQVAHLVMQTDCELTILRLSSLYGDGYDRGLIQRMLQQGQRTGSISLMQPFDDAFDLLHVSDAVYTIQSAIENSQAGVWNIGSEKLTTIHELAAVCAQRIDAQVILSDTGSTRPTRIINWLDDGKARRDLGHVNRITLDSGVAEIARSLFMNLQIQTNSEHRFG